MTRTRTNRSAVALMGWAGAALIATALCGEVAAQSTIRVSLSAAGTQGNFHSYWGALSADGRYVAFESTASNLVLVDANVHIPDIFLRDVQTGTTTLVSVDSAGVQGNSGSVAPSISADGRYVAFESLASNLVAGDTNATWDVFVHDQVTGITTRVSVNSAGQQGDNGSYFATISADGRFVAFESDAQNLVAGDTNAVRDVFVHDRQTGITSRVSTDSAGVEGNGASSWPTISADGRYVAYASVASNLVAGDTNGQPDIFVEDRQSGATVRASVDSAGVQGNLDSSSPSISGDGRLVAFGSDASNLVSGDTNAIGDVFAHDLQTGATTRVSVDSAGVQGNNQSLIQGNYQVSADGRFVAFDSVASNLVPSDTNGASDCFVHDRLTGLTTRVDVTTSGAQANSNARAPSISPDGRYVVFESSASNLVPGDNNLYWDVFRRDRGTSPVTLFCFGDGSRTACPCGNDSAAGTNVGCLNSLGIGGALGATGNASISADSLVLQGAGMPNSSALYFQGTSQAGAGAGTPFGDGLRCADGAVIRLGTKFNTAGSSQYPVLGDAPISVRGLDAAGDVRTYQCWYRNPAGPCSSGFNLTNGVQVTWVP